MINLTEQSIDETTPLLEANITNTNISCWKKDFGCCCITMLSSFSLSIVGLGVGAIYGSIKNNDASDINSVGIFLFLLGMIAGPRCGVAINDYLINRNSIKYQNNLNINDINDSDNNEGILQEVTIIDEDARPLIISSNTTKTSKLDRGLIKIQQTFQVNTRNNIEQSKDGMNEYYEKQLAREINNEDVSLNNNLGQKPNFTQIKAEIHSYSTNFNDQPSTSTGIYGIYHL